MSYNNRGWLTTILDAEGGISTNAYDNNGNITTTTDTLGRISTFQYDARNRLIGTKAADGGINRFKYDLSNNLTGTIDTLGHQTKQFYDTRNRLVRTVDAEGNQTKYLYDAANQLTATVDANGNRTDYSYDELGRQISVKDALGKITRFEYDSEGNRTKRVEIATGKVTEYVWDYRNRLSSVTFKDAAGVVTKTIEYLYDVNNQRIGKSIDGATVERYVYDRDQISLVFDGAGVQTHRYLYGTQVDQVLADERGGAVVWALADNLGTVRDVVDGGGVVLNHVTYDSYGKVVSQTNPAVEFRYGYTGREQDSETGLDYYRARYYDSAVGRFISEDPIGFNAGDTNIYRYVGNSPTNFTDPSGLDGQEIWGNFQPFNPFTLPMIGLGLIKAFSQGSFDAATKGGVLNAGSVNSGTLPSWVKQNDSNISWSGKKSTARPEDLDPNWWRKNPFIEPDLPRIPHTGHNNPRPNIDLNPAPFPGLRPGEKGDGVIPGKTRCLNDILIPPFLEVDIEPDKQGKHIIGHNNYQPGKSVITHPDPQGLLDQFSGQGQSLNSTPIGKPGSKERVNFGQTIGDYIDPATQIASPTTNGIIHYSSKGAYIVPARP